jgi:hypothetical protein
MSLVQTSKLRHSPWHFHTSKLEMFLRVVNTRKIKMFTDKQQRKHCVDMSLFVNDIINDYNAKGRMTMF